MAPDGEIWLMGVSCRVRVGVPDWERRKPQTILLDVGLRLPLGKAAKSDDVRDTADYGAVESSVRRKIEAGAFRLVERVAAVAAQEALRCDRRVKAVTVVVHKRPAVMPKTREVTVRISLLRR